ncbi:acetate/propionate family kinase [Aestuariibius insulae]|uniref:acetate/propionate family kinase n=1 Tax=Aestuariibius insulae TaxID=2058287 RepID=UPI00345F03AB
MTDLILVLNAGSSSLKFAVYTAMPDIEEVLDGQVHSLGAEAELELRQAGDTETTHLGQADHSAALHAILDVLSSVLERGRISAIGHRVVHGGAHFSAPVELTSDVLAELEDLVPLAPLHQPHNLATIHASIEAFPDALQVGCFDTAFHRTQPWVNDTYALPREYYDEGVRRYGFHGLSYDFISSALQKIAPDIASGRAIIAHLGNGASMCALKDGRSVGSTMGFSALEGLPMGTRSGQIDPGVLLYLMDEKCMSGEEISELLYKESGLKGLSGSSGDMRTLERSKDPLSDKAIDYFCHRIQREIGSLMVDLGGLDGLIFTGGIGENSALVRARVCDGLSWLGIDIDQSRNAKHETDIGTGRVRVLRIATDEERVIAQATFNLL